MTELWTGVIVVDGNPSPFEDVHLWSIHGNSRTAVPSGRILHFLSNVNLSSIPLYLATGPSSELSTTNASTAEWLQSRLAPNYDIEAEQLKLDLAPGKQLDIGILLRAEGSGLAGEVTELLLYAEVQDEKPPSSYSSDSTTPSTRGEVSIKPITHPTFLLKVYALPLSSNISPEAPITKDRRAQDLSRPSSSSSKRKNLTELFEDAALHRRKFNSRGGDRKLKAISHPDQIDNQQGSAIIPREGQVIENANRIQKSLSRDSSFCHDNNAAEASPVSQGASVQGKRSSLQHIKNALPPYTHSTSFDDGNDYAEHNKAALARVVMTGMRLHGLQQRKERASQSKQASDVKQQLSNTTMDTLDEGPDEYKLIYHQTFKAAIFALRGGLSCLPLAQETMRDVVDRLLEIFCLNTLSADGGNGSSGLTGTLVLGATDIFDLPSSEARVCSTRTTKKSR